MAAQMVLDTMDREEVRVNAYHYSAVVSACERSSQWTRALQLASLVPSCGIEADLVTCNAATSACESGSGWKMALCIFREIERSLRKDVISYNVSISACRLASWRTSLWLLEMCVVSTVQVATATLNSALASCGSSRAWLHALGLLLSAQRRRQSSLISFNSTISACELPAGLPTDPRYSAKLRWSRNIWQPWQRAMVLLHTLPSNRLEADIISFNAALGCCEAAAQWRWTSELLSQMLEEVLAPDEMSFRSVISSCEKGGLWQLALFMLATMPFASVQPTSFSYNAAVSACAQASAWQWALVVFAEMPGAAVRRDTVSFNASLKAAAQQGKAAKALETLAAMAEADILPNLVTFSTTIAACEKVGEWQHALQLLVAMCAQHIQADVISSNSAISACKQGHQWHRAAQLLWTMFDRLLVPNVVSYSTVVSACGAAGRWQLSLSWLDLMYTSEVPRTAIVLESSVAACEAALAWSHAARCLALVPQAYWRMLNAPAALNSYTALYHYLGGHWQSALALLHSMRRNQVRRDAVAFSAAISSCVEGSCIQVHDTSSYRHMINLQMCLLRNEWEAAIAILQAPRLKWDFLDMTSVEVAADVQLINDLGLKGVVVQSLGGLAFRGPPNWREVSVEWDKGETWGTLVISETELGIVDYSFPIHEPDHCEHPPLLLRGLFRTSLGTELFTASLTQIAPAALHLFSQMKDLRNGPKLKLQFLNQDVDLRPDVISCNAATWLLAISACGEEWRWAMDVCYNAAISACEKCGEWHQALELMNLQMRMHVPPDIITYNAVLSACEKGQQWQLALAFLARLEQNELMPDEISCNAAISACEKGNAWTCALALFAEFEPRSLQRDLITHNAVILACAEGREWRRALTLLDELPSAQLEPDEISFDAAIVACARASRPD
ncbi:unnamed protein product [Symbiodinium sp. CCMP2592]|nr:unnamed protein product [Symbiodinium sp. CCMP2592]